MRVICDTREQAPWSFEDQGIETVRASLETGDYSVEGLQGLVTIERKSIDDFTGTVLRSRARFYRELGRMRSYRFRCVIIESSVRQIMAGEYTSDVRPESVMGFIAEVAVGQAVPVYLGGTRAESQILAGAFLKMAAKKIRPGAVDDPIEG